MRWKIQAPKENMAIGTTLGDLVVPMYSHVQPCTAMYSMYSKTCAVRSLVL